VKFRTSILITSLIGTAALFAAGYAWFGARANEPASERATAVVERGNIEDSISALGTLQPRDFVDVGTQVSGQLKKLLVAVGDTVERGGLVAEIDPAVFAARVEAGKATLRSLAAQIDEKSAQYALASRQYERNAAMFKENAISEEVLETSATARRVSAAQIETLRAQQEQTSANLNVEQANLGYTRINSPIAGTVVALLARQGQTLNANQQAPIILRVANLDRMTVVTQVSEVDVVRVKPGMKAYFNTLGRPDRRWTGKVRQVMPTPETINNVVLYNVLFDVENTDRELQTQMSAQVHFLVAQSKDALLVPIAALRKGSKKQPWTVQVVKDGGIEEREVTVGITNRKRAEILSGLAEGEEVTLDATAESKRGGKKTAHARPAKL
jgi:macrolide-specific efflux system membrane fusion protein